MADLNTSYSGTVDWQDPDVVIDSVCKGLEIGSICIGGKRDIYLPESIRQEIRETNATVESTINAVKLPYNGSTTAERSAWVSERLNAINERVKFIKGRIELLLSHLQDVSNDKQAALTKAAVSALSLIPILGSLAQYAGNKENSAQALELAKTQSLIQDYTADLQQLATIRNQLLAEVVQSDPTTGGNATTNQAPTVQTWKYLVGLGLLLLFFVWLRRRNKKRRRR